MKRNRRAWVEDRWVTADGKRTARYGTGARWRARWVDDQGRERARAFTRKAEAQRWLDAEVTTALATGSYVAPGAGLITVGELHTKWTGTQGHLKVTTVATRESHLGGPCAATVVGGGCCRRDDLCGALLGGRHDKDRGGDCHGGERTERAAPDPGDGR